MKFIKPIITLLVIGGIAFWIFSTLKSNKEEIVEKASIQEEVLAEVPVRADVVRSLTVDNSLDLTGTFEARKELNVVAEGQGRITSLDIKEGQQVRKGQTVAKIDDTNIQAQMTTANATLAKAQKDVERYERLVKAGAISQQQYEEVKLAAANQQANLTNIRTQLKYSTARAPMSGVVKEVTVEQGSFATPGATIATIVDVENLKMVVKLGETEIIKVRRGQKVNIITEVYPDKVFTGTVDLVSVQADAGRKYEVEIVLANPKNTPLKPGMYGTVNIEPTDGETETALYVSRKAVLGSVQNPQVYVIAADNTVKKQEVKVGTIIEEKVEILSGLNAGDIVVTSGQINLSEGKAVKIINSQEVAKDKTSGALDTSITQK